MKPKKNTNSDLNGIRTHDFCGTSAVTTNWELVTLWVRNRRWWRMQVNIWKILYLNWWEIHNVKTCFTRTAQIPCARWLIFIFIKVVLWSNFYPFPWKNENAVYRLQISALVPEIFNFEKWVKYANEMTDDVIHSTQYYIKHINEAILANFPCRTLKLGRLIVLHKTHVWL